MIFYLKWNCSILSNAAIDPGDITSIEVFIDTNLPQSNKSAIVTDSTQIEAIYDYIDQLPKVRVPIPNLVGVGGSTCTDIDLMLDTGDPINLYVTNAWTTTLYFDRKYYKLLNDDIFDYLEDFISGSPQAPTN